ncbi:SDR family NAD(P)-dependent oxidoreductase [Nonomuraea soli]|uniref:2-hydroxycyclohexanecarboxyl-CoA dehydrogenase n=1 Tax=Nonomuraea soli TaxID=1032476 RepID=A0A7W0CCZ8_9ACTN|nr:SDR family NAD(P)-dependent oxidoreductase [Nonomuraea soli]MBA2888740.1 2-hydroxycyclohexanecarboxyl-CoA dehydrogenase [Nonomuraea soli]
MEGLRLDGRTAVVTGGAGAIGAAISRDLADLGAHVIVADRDLPGAEKIAAELVVELGGGTRMCLGRAAHLDLASPASIEEFAAAHQPDVVVHNAGVSVVEPFVAGDPAMWDLMWQVNLRGPMLLTKLVLPRMTERGWGRLVYISSDGARAGSGGEGAYAATKAGLFGLAKSLAREVARGGVTVNVVCPGPTDTPMLRRVSAEQPGLVDKLARAIPMRRLGEPADVAGLVAYLCTHRAAYITGQVLSVSGGVTMH